MTVRAIKQGDIEGVLQLARTMHAASPIYRRIPFCDEVALSWLQLAVDRPQDCVCRVAERDGEIVGVMLGCSGPLIFSKERYASELFLYVAEKFRGTRIASLLVKAFENWAQETGCVRICVGVSAGINDEQAERFYRKMGFSGFGKTFFKEF